jgi:hypothetical protein
MSLYCSWRPLCLLALLPLALPAEPPQRDPVPLKHWTAPQYFQTSRTEDASVVSTTPLTLVAITPCRIADTRPGSGYPALGSAPLAALTPHTLSIAGSCGTPASTSPALAYSLNVSVVPPAGTRGGYLTAYPNPASPAPSAASLTWNPSELYQTNAVVVEASSDGSVNILVNASTDVVVDINGYYIAQPSRNASLVFNASAMSAYPASTSTTVLQTTLISAVNSSLSFPATAWAIQPSSSVNLMLTFNVPVDFSTSPPPVVHVHFLTGPGSAAGTVVLPIFVCSVPAVISIPGSCFVGYPKAVVAFDAGSNSSIYTFNHYDLAYTLSGYTTAGHGINPGDFMAITLGRSTADTFGDQIYITSIEFRYPTN